MRKRRTIRDYILQVYYFLTLKIIYPAQYKIHARKPVVKGKVILLEPRFPETTDSLRQIKNALMKKGGYDILEMQLGIERLHLDEQNKRIMAFLREFATAEYVFTTDSNKTVGGFEKRPETKVVQVWHACGAFKRFGFSTAKLTFGGTSFKQKLYPLHRNYDVVTVSSPEVVWAYEEAMMLEGQNKVKPWGISRTDVFFNKEFLNSAKEAVHQAVPESAGKKIILYAPTFRGKVLYAESPDEMDLLKMKEALGEEYVLLIKHHPFVKNRPVINESCREFAFDVTDKLEIDQLLCISDICISDYSSLIFEYSLFERPMLFFAYDLDEYFDYRGFYYDYDEMTPGPIVRNTEEIIDYIANIDTRFDLQEVQAFRDKFMSSCDGHVTERILENICR